MENSKKLSLDAFKLLGFSQNELTHAANVKAGAIKVGAVKVGNIKAGGRKVT
jgi:hypothetical protein